MRCLSQKQYLWLIFFAAFVLRFGAALALRDVNAGPGWEFGADGRDFNELALSVSRGQGFCFFEDHPTSFRAPGFPVALAGVYAVVGERPVAAYVFFAVLGALSCVLTYAVVREINTQSRREAELLGRWSGVLCVFYIPHIYFATVFASENLFVPLLGGVLWCAIHAFKTENWRAWAACGVLLGAASLVRPFALLLAPLLVMLILYRRQTLRVALVYATVLGLSMIAVLAPWAARNFAVHDRFVLVATNGGSTFYGSNNDVVLTDPAYYGGWITTQKLPGRDLIESAQGEVAHDKVEWALGTEWVRENLTSMPRLLFYKTVRFWLPDVDSPNHKYVLLQIVGATPFLFLIVIGMFGLFARDHWTVGWFVMHASTIATVGGALIFWGSPRFRDANLIPMVAYGAFGLQMVVARCSRCTIVKKRPSAILVELGAAELGEP